MSEGTLGAGSSATNEYRNVKNVVLAGTLFLHKADYEALGRLCRGLKATDAFSKEYQRQIELGEHAHAILQALCRGSVRKSEGPGCAPCDAYIIASRQHGIPQMLDTVFPGCKVEDWAPKGIELEGRAKDLVEAIEKAMEAAGEVKASAVYNELGMTRQDYDKLIKNRNVARILEQKKIEIERGRGRGGSTLKRQTIEREGN